MLILYPTETVYGLGVDALNAEELDRLYALKGRNTGKGVSWLVASIADIERYGVMGNAAAKIAERFLPGPLTLVLAAQPGVPDDVLPTDYTIGFRISSDPIARALAAEMAAPITCTSANISGMPTEGTVPDILAQFSNRASMIDRVLNGGKREGPPSTVVQVIDDTVTIIREGAISAADILDTA